MRFIDWFAGIGGFRRGLELAGHECVGYCEFDKFATASYRSMHLITDKQREYLKSMELKQRQKEILKDEYNNGEWYCEDITLARATDIPRSDCWCFGFPCQDISIAGTQKGFKGNRSSLFFRVTRLLNDLPEEDRPSYLFIENVRNLLSINRGYDFARLLIELDKAGYNAEWQILNSKNFGVPQNRERVFIIGHFRGRGGHQIFPLTGTGRENNLKQLIPGMQGLRAYDSDGISCAFGIDKSKNDPQKINIANCIRAREDSGVSNRKSESTAVAIPVLTPDRINKRQNGRRCKDNNEPSFALTAQDRHEVAIKVREANKKGYAEAGLGDAINMHMPLSKTRRGRVGKGIAQTLDTACNQGILVKIDNCNFPVWAVWSEKYNCYLAIRKLTSKECFRLQGWEDEYFKRAEFVNSNSQLYKQAGNGVTVNVIEAIGKKIEVII